MMRSPFRAPETAEVSSAEGSPPDASPGRSPDPPSPAAQRPAPDANRDRSDTGSSWPGSLRAEGPPPKPALEPVATVLREESLTVALYLLGAAALRVVCRPTPAAGGGHLAAVLAATAVGANPWPQTETILQATWLYVMSSTGPAAAVAATGGGGDLPPRPRQPLLAARIAAWGLGRLRRRQLGLIAAVHVAVWLLYGALLARWQVLVAAEADAREPWSLASCARDGLRAALCVVLLYVGPTLLRLNRLPPGLVVLALRPPPVALRTAADGAALAASQVLGGLIAAHVLGHYFPDDPVH